MDFLLPKKNLLFLSSDFRLTSSFYFAGRDLRVAYVGKVSYDRKNNLVNFKHFRRSFAFFLFWQDEL